MPYDTKFAAKHGKRAARRELSQYGQSEPPTSPLERVEIDHTRADFIIVDDDDLLPLGRPTFTIALDSYTRYPLGRYMGFEAASYYAVMECLYHAILPKEDVKERHGTKHEWAAYGVPGTLVTDNGREFIGIDLDDACLLLGIILQRTPVRQPHFKGRVERFMRTTNTGLFHKIPGTTFSNPRQRGDYDSVEQACITQKDADGLLYTFLLDIYAERYHRGLHDVPARYWETKTQSFLPRVPASAKELTILLSRTTTRVVQHYGIEFEGLKYNCDELAYVRTTLKNEPAKIKYHPGDLTHIYVRIPDATVAEDDYIEVPALDEQYVQGLSLWKHRIIKANARANTEGKVDFAALGEAKRRLQDTFDRAMSAKKTNRRAARYKTGRPTSRRWFCAHRVYPCLLAAQPICLRHRRA
jgi:putative transposase